MIFFILKSTLCCVVIPTIWVTKSIHDDVINIFNNSFLFSTQDSRGINATKLLKTLLNFCILPVRFQKRISRTISKEWPVFLKLSMLSSTAVLEWRSEETTEKRLPGSLPCTGDFQESQFLRRYIYWSLILLVSLRERKQKDSLSILVLHTGGSRSSSRCIMTSSYSIRDGQWEKITRTMPLLCSMPSWITTLHIFSLPWPWN